MTIHISVSIVNDFNPKTKKNYRTQSITKFTNLTDIILNNPWSPITWESGLRLEKNYRNCDFLALDYDTGIPSISAMEKLLKRRGLRFLIGTTKSHQQEKHTPGGRIIPACDRYRVIIASHSFAGDVAQFKWQMREIYKSFPGCGSACVDAARYYWPCSEVVSMSDGRLFELPTPPAPEKLAASLKRFIKRDEKLGRCGIVPNEIKAFLRYGTHCGERRPSLFKYAARLTRMGWTEKEVMSRLYNAPFDKTGIDDTELIRHIQRGVKAGNGR